MVAVWFPGVLLHLRAHLLAIRFYIRADGVKGVSIVAGHTNYILRMARLGLDTSPLPKLFVIRKHLPKYGTPVRI